MSGREARVIRELGDLRAEQARLEERIRLLKIAMRVLDAVVIGGVALYLAALWMAW